MRCGLDGNLVSRINGAEIPHRSRKALNHSDNPTTTPPTSQRFDFVRCDSDKTGAILTAGSYVVRGHDFLRDKERLVAR